jgi:hypothetical protein
LREPNSFCFGDVCTRAETIFACVFGIFIASGKFPLFYGASRLRRENSGCAQSSESCFAERVPAANDFSVVSAKFSLRSENFRCFTQVSGCGEKIRAAGVLLSEVCGRNFLF